ncbi:hypothetical protein FRB99_000841 [Tulasnella sp. 403]|nr:hypothetical protein FRB99_000841 [Tulasnella sp. 403]
MSPPLPQSGNFIASVRDSCKALRLASGIRVDPISVSRFLLSPAFSESFDRLQLSHGVAMPLKFPNVAAELNLLSVLALLNFASGYRSPLHKATGRGAYDNIRALIFSLYLVSAEGHGPSNLLSAKGMQTITRERVAELLNISLHVETPHPTIAGLTIGQLGGPLLELAELIANVLSETGGVLERAGYPDLGAFVLEALKEAKTEGDKVGAPPLAEVVLERLVKAFPAFQDMAVALFLIHAIVLRFGGQTPSNEASSTPLPIPYTTNLPIFSDNVIPSMLVHLGVIDLSTSTIGNLKNAFPEAEAKVESLLSSAPKPPTDTTSAAKEPPPEGPRLSKDEAYALRAAAVDACEIIVEQAREIVVPEDKEKETWLRKITLPQLDGWLWSVAKDRADYRSLDRFVERPTPFY